MNSPDEVKQTYQDSEYIVMTAVIGYSGRRCYTKVALCEVKKGIVPKMISKRAKGMVHIWELHNYVRKGNGRFKNGYGYENILAKVTERCAKLNAHVTESFQ